MNGGIKLPIAAAPYEMMMQAKEKAIPIFASFELTPRCNFNCGMCYVHLKNSEIEKHGTELTAEQWISLGRQASQSGSLFLCITGGEPTMHPEFCRIYTELSRMGFIITLQSNLYHFSEECFALLEKYPPKVIKFTLYGADNETYRKVCGVRDGFTKVVENIKKIKAIGIPLIAVTTVTKDNSDSLPKIEKLMRDENIPWTASATLRKSIRGAETSVEKLRISEAELCENADKLTENNKFASKPCEKCREYKTGFWIKWDGTMSLCSFLREPEINAASLGFSEAWKSLVAFEEELEWPQECKDCKWFRVCPRCAATLATQSGTVNKVSKDYCQFIDSIFNKTIGGKEHG